MSFQFGIFFDRRPRFLRADVIRSVRIVCFRFVSFDVSQIIDAALEGDDVVQVRAEEIVRLGDLTIVDDIVDVAGRLERNADALLLQGKI